MKNLCVWRLHPGVNGEVVLGANEQVFHHMMHVCAWQRRSQLAVMWATAINIVLLTKGALQLDTIIAAWSDTLAM